VTIDHDAVECIRRRTAFEVLGYGRNDIRTLLAAFDEAFAEKTRLVLLAGVASSQRAKLESELAAFMAADNAEWSAAHERAEKAEHDLATLRDRLAMLSADWAGKDPRCAHMTASDCANELAAALEGKFAYLQSITAKDAP
jgi:hypothetical protein